MKRTGYNWGIFTARFPILNMRIEWPELIQGLVVSLSTGLALVPLLTSAFGLTFEEAVAIAMIHTTLATSNVILFGEPFASGWITAALPFTLALVLGDYETPTERFQMMTALSLDFAFLVFVLGITGFGKKLMEWVPGVLKAGIIMGAAFAAIKRVFYDDLDQFTAMPVSMTLALVISLIISFLPAFQKLKAKNKMIAFIASFGLLPGFIIAGLFGGLLGELQFDVQSGFLIPPFGSLMAKVSPFVIGFPSFEYFIAGLPLALITYLILFGDLLTGIALVEDAQKHRPDDPIDINLNRSHYAVAIRNGVMAIFAPFFTTQGVLWAGAQVLIIQRWKEGREKLESLFSGISAFYYYGIPVVLLLLPVVTFLRPFMPIALMLTLALTGVACSKLAYKMVENWIEKAMMFVIAILLCFYAPWIGLGAGVFIALVSTAIKKRI